MEIMLQVVMGGGHEVGEVADKVTAIVVVMEVNMPQSR